MKLRIAVEMELDIPVKREIDEIDIGTAVEGFYFDLGDLIEDYLKENNLSLGFKLISYDYNTDEVPMLFNDFIDSWGL